MIEKVEIFHVLTDTDSTSLKFVFISDPNSYIPENKFRDITFEVITASNIYKRFDSFQQFKDIFGSRKDSRQKKLECYEIENINNPCLVTLSMNPKEYLDLLKDMLRNKKQKRIN